MAIPPLTRQGAQNVSNYLDQLDERDFTKPDDDTLRTISALINQATADSFYTTDAFLVKCPEILKGVKILKAAPRTRGPARDAKLLLKGLTSY